MPTGTLGRRELLQAAGWRVVAVLNQALASAMRGDSLPALEQRGICLRQLPTVSAHA
jgi:hypothetical protein